MLGNEGGQYHTGIKFHIFLGYLCLFFESIHALYYLFAHVYDGDIYVQNNVLMPYGYNGTWGIISYGCLCIMCVFAVYGSRRKNFRLFMYTHYLYVVFLLAALFHFYWSWYPIVGAMLYILYDRLSTSLNMQRWNGIRIRQVSEGVTRVDIPRIGSKIPYQPGDWVKIQISKIDPTQWHPFSISSVYESSPRVLTLYVKNSGQWTKKLHALAGDFQGIKVPGRVTGVFGSRCSAYLSSPAIVFIGGGTGMAAILPFLRKYVELNDPRKFIVYLVWVAQKKTDILAFREFIVDLCDSKTNIYHLQLKLYLTKENPNSNQNIIEVDLTTDNDKKIKKANEPLDMNLKKTNDLDKQIFPPRNHSLPRFETPIKIASSSMTSLQHAPGTPIPIPEVDYSIHDRFLRVTLAIIVYGGGIAGYCLSRLFMFDYTLVECHSTSAVGMTSIQHFVCFYWMPWGPALSAATVALLFGSLFTFLSSGFNRQIKVEHEVVDDPYAYLPELDLLAYQSKRPDWDSIFDEIDQKTSEMKGVSVVAAGPEKMMQN
ncbi:hypothetical protein HK096_007288, partial [Nowakowskiella sp. JEL0078]